MREITTGSSWSHAEYNKAMKENTEGWARYKTALSSISLTPIAK